MPLCSRVAAITGAASGVEIAILDSRDGLAWPVLHVGNRGSSLTLAKVCSAPGGMNHQCVTHGPVLLVDDRVDTGWTMTFGTKLLAACDVRIVLPFAFAVTN